MDNDAFVRVPEVDLFGLGLIYFSTGFPALDVILGLTPFVFYLALRTLEGPQWRLRVRDWLVDGAWSAAYRGLLDDALRLLQFHFRNPLSLTALDMCFRLAVAYASLHILIRGAAGGLASRSYALIEIAVLLGVGFWAARRIRTSFAASRDAAGDTLRSQAVEKGMYLCATALAIAIVQAGMPEFFVFVVLAGASMGAGMAFAAPSAVLAIAAYPLTGPFAGGVFVYFLMFPGLNALFDWPSWAASRWLMARLSADADQPRFIDRLGRLTGHIAIDIAIAVLCLYGLAVSIVLMTETNQGMLMWDRIFSAGLAQPLAGDGLILTVMLFSTLVPTMLHLFFAVFALAVIRAPGRRWIAGWLDEEAGAGEWASRAIVAVCLTACSMFAMVVLWLGAEGIGAILNDLWGRLGLAGPNPDYPFLSSVYEVAGGLARLISQ